MQRKFAIAISCYAALALLGTFLPDGPIRDALWLFLGGLALRTYAAKRAGW